MPQTQFTESQLSEQKRIYDAYTADPSILKNYTDQKQRAHFVKIVRSYQSYLKSLEAAPVTQEVATEGQVIEADTSAMAFPTTTAVQESTGIARLSDGFGPDDLKDVQAPPKQSPAMDAIRAMGQAAVDDLKKQTIQEARTTGLGGTQFDPIIVKRIQEKSGMTEEQTIESIAGTRDFTETTGNVVLDDIITFAKSTKGAILGIDAALLKEVGLEDASEYIKGLATRNLREAGQIDPTQRGELKGEDLFSLAKNKPGELGGYLLHKTLQIAPQMGLVGVTSFAGMASLGLTILGGVAAGNKYMADRAKGVPHNRALVDAILTGGVEVVTEKFGSFETAKQVLTNTKVVKGMANKAWEVTKAFHTAGTREAAEEFTAGAGGTAAGQISGADKEKFVEAFTRDLPQFFEQAILAYAPGGLFGAGGTAVQQARAGGETVQKPGGTPKELKAEIEKAPPPKQEPVQKPSFFRL